MLKRLKNLGITIFVSTSYMEEASICDRIALIQQGNIMSVATPPDMTKSFPEDLWIISSKKIYSTSILLEKLPSLISVNSFGQVLHLVTKRGVHTAGSIQQFILPSGETSVSVIPAEATIEDVFILLMHNRKTKP
jgi:ABC-2 type transport system ATP-binding protein